MESYFTENNIFTENICVCVYVCSWGEGGGWEKGVYCLLTLTPAMERQDEFDS